MPRHHLIITGTGRSGTTFLVQLLTALGADTGFTTDTEIYENCDAGLEWDLRDPGAPYVVKSPWLCDYLDELLQDGSVVVDHAIVPMRDLYAAAESRRDVERRTSSTEFAPGAVPGGLWHTEEPSEQEAILTRQLYKVILALAKHDVPVTLLVFPRLVTDPEYLYGRIGFALGETTYDEFLDAFRKLSRPELVHDFESHAASRTSA